MAEPATQEEAITSALENIGQRRDEIGDLDTGQDDYGSKIESLRDMEQELDNLETMLADFQGGSPDVLVLMF